MTYKGIPALPELTTDKLEEYIFLQCDNTDNESIGDLIEDIINNSSEYTVAVRDSSGNIMSVKLSSIVNLTIDFYKRSLVSNT